MVICAAGWNHHAPGHAICCQSTRVFHNTLWVYTELMLVGLRECHRLCCHALGQQCSAQHHRAAFVPLFPKLVGVEKRPTARSTTGLMRGRRNDRDESNRTLVAHKDTSSSQPGKVRQFCSGEPRAGYTESPKTRYSFAWRASASLRFGQSGKARPNAAQKAGL
jgi:hypothetical protein